MAQKSKVEHENESVKETISFAWSASMTKYYEDITKGNATEADIEKYFSKEMLNLNLGTNNGEITDVVYNNVTKKTEIIYKNNLGTTYKIELDSSGAIGKLEKTNEAESLYTQLWISYYVIKENETDLIPTDVILAFSRTKEARLPERPTLEPETQLDVTEGADKWVAYGNENYTHEQVVAMIAHYTENVKTARILENITPKHTNFMFRGLINLEQILGPNGENNGLDYIDFSYCGMEDRVFSSCLKITSIKLPNTVKTIDDYAINYCPVLESLEIPSSVTRISSLALMACDNSNLVVTIHNSASNVEGSENKPWGAGVDTTVNWQP